MRRAIPTRPLWLLKNSQLTSPAALAIALTRRAICDSESPNTFTSLPAPTGRMAQGPHGDGSDGQHGPLGQGVGLGADHGDAAAAVVPGLDISPGQRRRLGTPQPSVRQNGYQGHQVEAGALGGLREGLHPAAPGTGFRGVNGGGKVDHMGGSIVGLRLS